MRIPTSSLYVLLKNCGERARQRRRRGGAEEKSVHDVNTESRSVSECASEWSFLRRKVTCRRCRMLAGRARARYRGLVRQFGRGWARSIPLLSYFFAIAAFDTGTRSVARILELDLRSLFMFLIPSNKWVPPPSFPLLYLCAPGGVPPLYAAHPAAAPARRGRTARGGRRERRGTPPTRRTRQHGGRRADLRLGRLDLRSGG